MLDASTVATKKIYYDDPYAVTFEARVVSFENGDLVLDRTAFFPEEGGQNPDKGILAECHVADVKIKKGFIHHFLEAEEGEALPDLREGDLVTGTIDWDHRFSNMQQHSGEHLFSGIAHTLYGCENVGFHLSEKEVTVDFDRFLSDEELLIIEARVNEAISQNVPSHVEILNGREAEEAEYRSKLALTKDVRVVSFPGFDACACCAPHVSRTGEIGLLKVVRAIKWRTGVRVTILSGSRAMALFDRDHEILTRTAQYLTTSVEGVYGQVVKMKEELAALKAQLRAQAILSMRRKVAQVESGEGNAVIFETDVEQEAAREAVNALVEKKSGYCGVFIGTDDTGYRYIVGRKGGDARVMNALLRERFGARGGGQPAMVQGSVACSGSEILALFEEIRD